jgi:DNA polymerase III epsilon subunit family exonuclease
MIEITNIAHSSFAVIDVETTGLNPSADVIVEVACLTMRGNEEREAFSTLVNPGRSIPREVAEIHGITDADVTEAPTFTQVAPKLRALCENAVVVAHNASFDLGFLPQLADRPSICTMRLAQLVLPAAPNYKNQGLREYLAVSDPRLENASAHRALADVIVTSLIFKECLRRYLASGGADDLSALIAKLNEPRVLRTLPFGKHRGQPIDSIPTDYLQWLIKAATSISDDARLTAKEELLRRSSSCA